MLSAKSPDIRLMNLFIRVMPVGACMLRDPSQLVFYSHAKYRVPKIWRVGSLTRELAPTCTCRYLSLATCLFRASGITLPSVGGNMYAC